MIRRFYIILFLILPFAASAQVTLLKDINNSATLSGSNPNNLIAFNGFIYYTASDGVTGTELWRTDGTVAGTSLVMDINPGDGSSGPSRFIVLGSYLYFRANDGEVGIELWRTDGTAAGTKLVADINPGLANSSPDQLTVVGATTMYFAAANATTGRELYKTDASALSVTLISDINSTAAAASSNPSYITYVSGTTVYFAANDGTSGSELWKSDGTSIGTQRIKDIFASGTNGSNPSYLTLIGTTVVFQATDGTNGYEVWACTNGTSAGTTMISDINFTAGQSSYPSNFIKYGNLLYFTADDGGFYGNEIYRTDGTSVGTYIILNVAPTANIASNASNFTVMGGNLYFVAQDGTNGYELYKYTGSGNATLFNINITSGASSYPYYLTAIGSNLYFQATTTAAGYEMYKFNGTSYSLLDLLSGTGSSNPYNFAGLGTNVLFSADAGTGYELWKYDGTTTPNSPLVDLISGSGSSDPSDFTYNAVTPNGTVFFAASNGSNGYELWKTDGTTLGTSMLKDINPTGDSYPSGFTVVGNYVFFQAYDGGDSELWRTDGTPGGTVEIDLNPGTTASSSPYNFIALNSTTVVFSAYHATYGQELFKVVGTGAPTVVDIAPTTTSSYPSYQTLAGGAIYFQANDGTYGYELWKYDGTTASRMSDIAAGSGSSYPYAITAFGSTVLFQADGSTLGNYELYKCTGTFASTALVKEINPSATSGSYPYAFTTFGSYSYFQADDGTNGYELWRTDGTTGGTTLVKDIFTGANNSSSPANFYVYNNQLFFSARTLANGYELWMSTDGTAANTNLFKDMNPGQPNGGFTTPLTYNGRMYFLGSDGSGARIWVTDGRSCGTIAAPSFAGAATSSANDMTLATFSGVPKIIFSMNAKGYEREPFLLDPAGITMPVDAAITAHPQSQSVAIFSSVTFTVTATGTGLTYQWQKGGVNIVGATSASYNIPSAADTDAGDFRVVVTGTCGQQTSNVATLTVNAATPTAQPTGFTISSPTPTSLGVSFTAASPAASGYLVIRKKGSTPTEVPVDGTTYTVGGTIGASTVVKASATTSGTDSGLDNTSEYFYAVFSYNGGGALVKYLTTTPLKGSGITLAVEPSEFPSNLAFSGVEGTTLTGSFTAAAAGGNYLVVRKVGSAPSTLPADGKIYSVGETLGDGTVAYFGSATTFDDTGLTPETTYYYRVFYSRGINATVNYNTTNSAQNFTKTLIQQPDAPTQFKFTNVTPTSFTVTFTAPATLPQGYVVFRNKGNSLTAVPIDGTTYALGQTVGDGRVAYIGANTTFDENLPLSVATDQYTYAVFPFNGTGSSINYRTTTPLTGFIAPDESAPDIDVTQTQAAVGAGSGVTIIAAVTEPQSGIQQVTVEYRSVAKGGATTVKDMSLIASKYQYDIPANEIGDLGIEFTVTATNTVTKTSTKSGKVGVTFNNQTISLNSFGDAESNYRIVAVPMNLSAKSINDVFADDLGEYDGKAWRMYRYEAGSTVELQSSSTIEAGKGYWLIVRENKTIDTGAGQSVPVTTLTPFTIDLKTGWNQIGNPYNFNVLWSEVLAASNLNIKLRTYTGQFTDASVLNKFQGGFVLANSDGTLKFPTQYNGAAGREMEASKKLTNSIDQENWEVTFDVKHDGVENSFGGVGMNTSASPQYDEFDDFTLPRFINYVELNHAKKFSNIYYTKDVVPTADNFTWDFKVEARTDGPTEITWDNSYFGVNDRQLVLWDEEESMAIDMRTTGSYYFNQRGARKFKVFYGNEKYITENALAHSVVIHSLAPNPTDGDLSVLFSIPGTEQSVVEVKVLNTLGQPVASLFKGQMNGGMHTMTWSGKDHNGMRPSQGVYLVEVIANGQRLAKRVVLK